MLKRFFGWIGKLWAYLKGEETRESAELSPPKLESIGVSSNLAPPLTVQDVPIPQEMEISAQEPPQYRKRDYFFSYRERQFYNDLRSAVGNDYQVFAKVRMADVVFVANEPENRKYFNNQILCKHFDFVLCEPDKQKPILVIELDDSSHSSPEKHARDELKDKICNMAGLPLLRVSIQNEYSRKYLLGLIGNKILKSSS